MSGLLGGRLLAALGLSAGGSTIGAAVMIGISLFYLVIELTEEKAEVKYRPIKHEEIAASNVPIINTSSEQGPALKDESLNDSILNESVKIVSA